MGSGMIVVTGKINIPETEIQFEFIRSSGPGGQNVNKVASAVQLRFNIAETSSLTPEVKERAVRLAGRRVAVDGTLIIDSRQHRSQKRNRQDALVRFIELIRIAAIRPKHRVKTKPSRGSVIRRLDSKNHRSKVKKQRRAGREDE
jgi:ribosome-associated protein